MDTDEISHTPPDIQEGILTYCRKNRKYINRLYKGGLTRKRIHSQVSTLKYRAYQRKLDLPENQKRRGFQN